MRNYQNPSFPKNTTAKELRRLLLPTWLAGLIFCLVVGAIVILDLIDQATQNRLLGLTIFGILYGAGLYGLNIYRSGWVLKLKWVISLMNALLCALGFLLLPPGFGLLAMVVVVTMTAASTIIWNSQAAYTSLAGAILLYGVYQLASGTFSLMTAGNIVAILLIGSVIIDALDQLIRSTRARVERLETINQFARQIALSLETQQVLSLLQAALHSAMEADTVYVGLVNGNKLRLEMFYDDGEYFPAVELEIKGTLSGWVVRHQRSLFVADLRKPLDLDDVDLVIIGQDRSSLSWIGVPMITPHITGILSISSYRPNAFDISDVELLENLAQQAALAIENAYHHAEVEEQSRLDPLTKTFNHGYFLEHAERQAEDVRSRNSSMSLIMLDIDFFKQYNDTYGHLVGDEVLIQTTRVIREHIHTTDAVGRWGGEEFVILLLDTTGAEAINIAHRIRQSLADHPLSDRDGNILPLPTVSQGIAVFPYERDEIIKLVDLADQRLYHAKERGRNQVEPGEDFWK